MDKENMHNGTTDMQMARQLADLKLELESERERGKLMQEAIAKQSEQVRAARRRPPRAAPPPTSLAPPLQGSGPQGPRFGLFHPPLLL